MMNSCVTVTVWFNICVILVPICCSRENGSRGFGLGLDGFQNHGDSDDRTVLPATGANDNASEVDQRAGIYNGSDDEEEDGGYSKWEENLAELAREKEVGGSQNSLVFKLQFRTETAIYLKRIIQLFVIETRQASYCQPTVKHLETIYSSTSSNDEPIVTTDAETVNITNLAAGTRYEISVAAGFPHDCNVSESLYSATFWTLALPPSHLSAPRILCVTGTTIFLELDLTVYKNSSSIEEQDRRRHLRAVGHSAIDITYLVIVDLLVDEKSAFRDRYGNSSNATIVDMQAIGASRVTDLLPIRNTNETSSSPVQYYVAARFHSNKSKLNFTVGDGQQFQLEPGGLMYVNAPLVSDTWYSIWVSVVSRLDAVEQYAFTSIDKPIYLVATSKLVVADGEGVSVLSATGIACLVSSLCILLIIIAIITSCLLRRYCARNNDNAAASVLNRSGMQSIKVEFVGDQFREIITTCECNDTKATDDCSGEKRATSKTMVFNSSFYAARSVQRTPVTRLRLHYETKLRPNAYSALLEEFRNLPDDIIDSMNVAAMPCNAGLNSFQHILPYDKNRVKLIKRHKDDGTYINASYVRTIGHRLCVVTQTPLATTVDDFWRMIWDVRVGTIVALVEETPMMMFRYWPEEATNVILFGDIHVEMVGEIRWAHYILHNFQLTYVGAAIQDEAAGVTRRVAHWQYFAWKTGGLPKHPLTFLSMVMHIRQEHNTHTGVTVHCSVGGGRSGLYVAVDALLTEGQLTGKVDVVECVTMLRLERINLIRTVQQYRFIYSCLIEAFDRHDTRMPVEHFPYMLRNVRAVTGSHRVRLIDKEYAALKLPFYGVKSYHCPNGDIPMTCDLMMNNSAAETHLLPDAMPLDGYRLANQYLLMKSPPKDMLNTERYWSDCFEKVCECRVPCIVLLSAQPCSASGHRLPGEGSSVIYRKYKVTCDSVRVHSESSYIVHSLTVRRVESGGGGPVHHVNAYEMLKWYGGSNVLPPISPLLDTLTAVRGWYCYACQTKSLEIGGHDREEGKEKENGKPVMLIGGCVEKGMNDRQRAAIFCIIWMLVDRIETDDTVDVYSAARYVCSYLPTAINSLDEYEFLYTVMLEYLLDQAQRGVSPNSSNCTPLRAPGSSFQSDKKHVTGALNSSNRSPSTVMKTITECNPAVQNNTSPNRDTFCDSAQITVANTLLSSPKDREPNTSLGGVLMETDIIPGQDSKKLQKRQAFTRSHRNNLTSELELSKASENVENIVSRQMRHSVSLKASKKEDMEEQENNRRFKYRKYSGREYEPKESLQVEFPRGIAVEYPVIMGRRHIRAAVFDTDITSTSSEEVNHRVSVHPVTRVKMPTTCARYSPKSQKRVSPEKQIEITFSTDVVGAAAAGAAAVAAAATGTVATGLSKLPVAEQSEQQDNQKTLSDAFTPTGGEIVHIELSSNPAITGTLNDSELKGSSGDRMGQRRRSYGQPSDAKHEENEDDCGKSGSTTEVKQRISDELWTARNSGSHYSSVAFADVATEYSYPAAVHTVKEESMQCKFHIPTNSSIGLPATSLFAMSDFNSTELSMVVGQSSRTGRNSSQSEQTCTTTHSLESLPFEPLASNPPLGHNVRCRGIYSGGERSMSRSSQYESATDAVSNSKSVTPTDNESESRYDEAVDALNCRPAIISHSGSGSYRSRSSTTTGSSKQRIERNARNSSEWPKASGVRSTDEISDAAKVFGRVSEPVRNLRDATKVKEPPIKVSVDNFHCPAISDSHLSIDTAITLARYASAMKPSDKPQVPATDVDSQGMLIRGCGPMAYRPCLEQQVTPSTVFSGGALTDVGRSFPLSTAPSSLIANQSLSSRQYQRDILTVKPIVEAVLSSTDDQDVGVSLVADASQPSLQYLPLPPPRPPPLYHCTKSAPSSGLFLSESLKGSACTGNVGVTSTTWSSSIDVEVLSFSSSKKHSMEDPDLGCSDEVLGFGTADLLSKRSALSSDFGFTTTTSGDSNHAVGRFLSKHGSDNKSCGYNVAGRDASRTSAGSKKDSLRSEAWTTIRPMSIVEENNSKASASYGSGRVSNGSSGESETYYRIWGRDGVSSHINRFLVSSDSEFNDRSDHSEAGEECASRTVSSHIDQFLMASNSEIYQTNRAGDGTGCNAVSNHIDQFIGKSSSRLSSFSRDLTEKHASNETGSLSSCNDPSQFKMVHGTSSIHEPSPSGRLEIISSETVSTFKDSQLKDVFSHRLTSAKPSVKSRDSADINSKYSAYDARNNLAFNPSDSDIPFADESDVEGRKF